LLPQEIGTAGQIMHIADDDPDYEMRTYRG